MIATLDALRHRFSRAEYERMVDVGILGPNKRLKLLDGEIIDMSPQESRHATAVTLAGDSMRAVFKENATVRLQLPFSLDNNSEPEPDLAVVPGNPRDYRDNHPSRALLIIEVSDTTLTYDRDRKSPAYARAGIPQYWILDLTGETLEVYRDPTDGTYAEQLTLQADGKVRPLATEDVNLTVKDLLP